MQIIKNKFPYESYSRETIDGKRYYTVNGEKLISVTTILDATGNKDHLIAWKARLGEAKATQVTKDAAAVGTALHANLERFVKGEQRQPGNNFVHIIANKMADQIIKNGLSKVSEVWAIEQSLYYPGLYSGTTDLIGLYDGEPAIIDFKQSNRKKKSEWVDSYRMQLCAYIMAHNVIHNTDIRRGVVMMCTRDHEYQQFDITRENFEEWSDKWLSRVELYYKMKNDN